MNDTYFTDRDGTPLTGKVPIQLFFEGDGDTGKIRAAANGALAAFLHAVNTSTLQQLNRTVILGSTARMRMSYSFGLVRVVITTKKVQEPPAAMFHGGILIQAFGDVSPYPTEVRTSGKSTSKVGRPAAPGTAEADETNWLIVWIRGDKPLGLTPIADGNMAIYRIKDPLFGEYVEVSHDPRSFLLSTTATFADFYLCGRKVTNIPPMFTPVPGTFDLPTVRICTLGLTFDSFVTADAAEGAVIVALAQKLYVLHTRDRTETEPAPWQLLDLSASIAPEDINTFGSTITKVRNPDGSVVVTCSGTNGVGLCSGFVVTFTDTGITGSLSLVHNGRIPARAAEETYTRTIRAEYGAVQELLYVDHQVYHTVDTANNTVELGEFDVPIYNYGRGSTAQGYSRYYRRDETPAQYRDVFGSGYLPIDVPHEMTVEWTKSVTVEPVGWTTACYGGPWGSFKGLTGNFSGSHFAADPPPLGTTLTYIDNPPTHLGLGAANVSFPTANYYPALTPKFKVTYTALGSCYHSTGIPGDVGHFEASARKVYGVCQQSAPADQGFAGLIQVPISQAEKDAWASAEHTSSVTYDGGAAQTIMKPSMSLRYPAKDYHVEALAWRHRASQSGTITFPALGLFDQSPTILANWSALSDTSEFGGGGQTITLFGSAPGVSESFELIDPALARAGKVEVIGGWTDLWSGATRTGNAAPVSSGALATTIAMPIEYLIDDEFSAADVSPPYTAWSDGLFPNQPPLPDFIAAWSVGGPMSSPETSMQEGAAFSYDFIYPSADTVTEWANGTEYAARFPTVDFGGPVPDTPLALSSFLACGQYQEPDKTRAVASPSSVWILRDVRTQGFLTSVNVSTAGKFAILAGNRYGTIPFATAYSEWIRLGAAPMTGYDDTVGIQSTLRVSLL